jgi:cytochrome c
MKKNLTIIGLALLFASCGNNNKSGSSTTTTDTTTSTTKTSSSTSPMATDTAGKALMANSDCMTCHKIDQKVVGPALKDIAQKYTASPAVIDTLANKIIKGGSGNWGSIAMSPHPAVSMDDARSMVKYILSLK